MDGTTAKQAGKKPLQLRQSFERFAPRHAGPKLGNDEAPTAFALVSRFGPAERLGIGIVHFDVGAYGGFQLGCRSMYAAADLVIGKQAKEPLNLIDP